MSKRFAFETEKDIFASRLFSLMQGPPKTTQDELAAVVGVTRQSIAQYVSGQSKPNTVQIVKIAQYFGVTTDWLLGLTDNKIPENQAIGEYLGLEDTAIQNLHSFAHSESYGFRVQMMKFINKFLSSPNIVDEMCLDVCLLDYSCDCCERYILRTLKRIIANELDDWKLSESMVGSVILDPPDAVAYYAVAIQQKFSALVEEYTADCLLEINSPFLPEGFFQLPSKFQSLVLNDCRFSIAELCKADGLRKEDVVDSLNSMIETGTDPNGIFAAKKGEPLFKKWMSKIVEEVKSGRTIEV